MPINIYTSGEGPTATMREPPYSAIVQHDIDTSLSCGLGLVITIPCFMSSCDDRGANSDKGDRGKSGGVAQDRRLAVTDIWVMGIARNGYVGGFRMHAPYKAHALFVHKEFCGYPAGCKGDGEYEGGIGLLHRAHIGLCRIERLMLRNRALVRGVAVERCVEVSRAYESRPRLSFGEKER